MSLCDWQRERDIIYRKTSAAVQNFLMTTFGWKRKAGACVVSKAAIAFEKDAKDEELDNEVTRGEVDWLNLAPKKRLISLEDAKAKSWRLRDEGATLAQAERYWEAIKKWDEALLLRPDDSKTLEMKAQALMAVGEAFPAVHTAQEAVKSDPTWWEARQTLGRAQLNLGEVKLAIRSFSKAVVINPVAKELWEDDLTWACSVRDRMNASVANTAAALLKDGDSGTDDSSILSSSNGGSDLETELVPFDRREANDRQILLKVPSNYVHLRG